MSGRREMPQKDEPSKLKGFDDFDLLLGDIMRGERATLGKSLLDVQRKLKIKANYIAAIENTDASAFETPGFVAGYVRSYARYLGLDPEWAFKTFCEEGNFQVAHGMSADASVRRKSKPSRKSEPGQGPKPAHLRDPFTEPSVSYMPKAEAVFAGFEPRAIGSVMVLLALIASIGYGGWAVLQEVQKVRLTPVDQTPEVLAELDPLAPTIPAEAGDRLENDDGVKLAEGFDRLYRPEALEVPVLVARDGPIASIDPTSIGVLAPVNVDRVIASMPPTGAEDAGETPGFVVEQIALQNIDQKRDLPPVQVVAVSSPSVSLLAVRPSWVRVTGADGTVIFEKILDAGEEFNVPLTESFASLRAGNAESLYFSVNGQTYGPAGSGPEVVKDVVLEPDALRQSYALADAAADSDLARFVAVAEASQ
ncbi:MAG: DUF4115 domain-containing protein [Boseongicola sp.]|nr:MAG: DUF4115 domain-containing protein [Boseongicola sp.]